MLSNRVKRLIGANEAELAGVAGNLLSAAKGREIKTIFVTSSRNAEGKTTAAIAIAQSLAANGRNVTVHGASEQKSWNAARCFFWVAEQHRVRVGCRVTCRVEMS